MLWKGLSFSILLVTVTGTSWKGLSFSIVLVTVTGTSWKGLSFGILLVSVTTSWKGLSFSILLVTVTGTFLVTVTGTSWKGLSFRHRPRHCHGDAFGFIGMHFVAWHFVPRTNGGLRARGILKELSLDA